MIKRFKQRGFLMIAVIALIVVAGFYGVIFTHILSSGADANVGYNQAMQSYYIAQAGLNRGLFAINSANVQDNPDPSTTPDVRTSCTTISNVSFGSGQFNVSTASNFTQIATLTSSIGSSDTAIDVNSTVGLAGEGMLYIGNEKVKYTAMGTCDGDPCITGLTRGYENTLAQPHDNGTYVSELACNLVANGGVPSIASAHGSTTLSASANMETAFAVGAASGKDLNLLRWNLPTSNEWSRISMSNSSNNAHLRAVTAAGPDYAWTVGDDKNNEYLLYSWNAATQAWQQDTSPSVSHNRYVKDLDGVSAASPKDVWAVGSRSDKAGNIKRRYLILRHYNGNWCVLEPSSSCGSKTIPADNNSNEDLRGVSVLDTTGDGFADIGFAVGDGGQILKYDGTNWSKETSPTSRDLFAVKVVSSSEAWAAGDRGTVIRWNGTSWSTVSGTGIPTDNNLDLYAITTLKRSNENFAYVGWIVGRSGGNGVAYRFTQSSAGSPTWATNSPTGGANKRLRGVAMLRENDVWAVGNSARTIHWDGSNWTQITSNGLNKNLLGIALVGPTDLTPTTFREQFN